MKESNEKLHAARHEAGHAVIGFFNGRHPSSIFICEKDQRWVGDCRFPPGKVQEPAIAMTAIAGVLAQAKSNAIDELEEPLRFNNKAAPRLIPFLRDSQRSNDEPGETTVSFLTESNEMKDVRLDGWWYSGADQQTFRESVMPLVVGNIIQYTMEDLDKEENWNAVCGLADRLVASDPQGQEYRHELLGSDVVEYLTSAGLGSGQN